MLLKNRGFLGIQRHSILENGFDGVRQECLLLKLITAENDRLVELRLVPE